MILGIIIIISIAIVVLLWFGNITYSTFAHRNKVAKRWSPALSRSRYFFGISLFIIVYFQPNVLQFVFDLFKNKLFTSLYLLIVGSFLLSFGLVLHLWGRINLGLYWSTWAEIKENHQIIKQGAFSLVRHPMYSGIIIASLGSFLISGLLGWLVVFFISLLIGYFKALTEEYLLVSEFGNEYQEYRERVPTLLPFKTKYWKTIKHSKNNVVR